MDSLRKRSDNKNERTEMMVDVMMAKKITPANHFSSSRAQITDKTGQRQDDGAARFTSTSPKAATSKDHPVEISAEENMKIDSSRRTRTIFSIALFLMIVGFALAIGWHEFKNKDDRLEKLLSKNTASTEKSAALEPSSASNIPPRPSEARVPPENKNLPVNNENINTGATSPQEELDRNSNEKKKYASDKEDVSFDYPSEYKIEENNGQISAIKNETMWRMKIYDNKDKKALKEWFDENFTGSNNASCVESNSDTLKIGSYVTKLMKAGDDGKCEGMGYFAINSDMKKVVRVRLDKADEAEANKILSSFKFAK